MKTFKLALSAGHGIHTEGRRIPPDLDPEQHREWWLNDRVCRYIEQAAKQYQGFEVLRVDDVTGLDDLPMSVRCWKANDWGADLYYSAHHNAGINGGRGGGVVAYALEEGSKAADWRNALYDSIVAATGLKGNRSTPKAIGNFYELRNTEMPAVLVEHGFMDSPEDVPIILQEEFAKNVGKAVAGCIAKRAGLKKIKEKEPEMTREEVEKIARESASVAVADAMGPHYYRLGDVTKRSYRAMLDKLVKNGYILGREGEGEDMVIDLYESDVRALVITGRALEAAGLL